MSQEFHIEETDFAAAEKRMNELGGEGWLAVNCWPTEPGKIALVMKREKTFVALHKRLIEPARPLKDLDLKAVLEICLRHKKPDSKHDGTMREGEQYGVAVSNIAGEFGTTAQGVVEHLKTLGFITTKKKYVNTEHLAVHRL